MPPPTPRAWLPAGRGHRRRGHTGAAAAGATPGGDHRRWGTAGTPDRGRACRDADVRPQETPRREGRLAPATRACPRQPVRVDRRRVTPRTQATGTGAGPHHGSACIHLPARGAGTYGRVGLSRGDRPRRAGWRRTPPPAAPTATRMGEKPRGHPPSVCAPEGTHNGPPDARVPTGSRRRRRTPGLRRRQWPERGTSGGYWRSPSG